MGKELNLPIAFHGVGAKTSARLLSLAMSVTSRAALALVARLG